MEFSSAFTFRQQPQENQESTSEAPIPVPSPGIHCPHFAGFIAVSFAKGHNTIGLQPVISNAAPTFQDISLGGGSFDVRKVEASSFPIGLGTQIFKGRKYVAVKHPRTQDDGSVSFADIALELQILRHPPVQKHENIVDLLAVMYHDTGNKEGIRVVPALVLEYAEYGNLKSYQEAGYAHSLHEKLEIAIDAARGLEGLHEAGIVHGDVKPSNLLVFKHPTKKTVVKISDFGFAMPMQGGQLIGSTEVYRAPEADTADFNSRYLRQQDIYSFGLTLWTVLGDGVAYHSTLPDGDKLENVWKLKKSNLIASLATFNVLHRLRRENYPLMTLAKVILTCLQFSPERRFSSMSKIIDHLEVAKSIFNSLDGHDTPDASALRAALPTFESIVYRAKIPASDEERSERMILKGLTTLVFAYLRQELGLQNTPANIDPWQICNMMTHFLPKAHERYYSSFDQDESPFITALKGISKARLEKTISELLPTISQLLPREANPDDNSEAQPVSAVNACLLILDCAGLLNEPFNTVLFSAVTSKSNVEPMQLFKDEDFIPDIKKSSNILQKTPKPARVALLNSLKTIFETSTNQNERAQAALNLASAYMDDIGVEYDLKSAAYYIRQAAQLGSEKARTLYLSVFSQVVGQETPDVETLRTWVLDSAQAGNPVALQKLKVDWPLDWQEINQKVQLDELTRLGVNVSASEDLSSMLQALSLSDIEFSHTRDLLLWSIVMDKPDVAATCLDQSHDLVELALQNDETPLLLATRLGRKHVLEVILQHPSCGSAAQIADERGITPLHWLCSFADEDHEVIAKLLFSKGADLNSPACTISRTQYGIKVDEDGIMAQTPLHWAITQKRLSAVDALLKLGADPTFCMEVEEREGSHLSPLELACGLCYSPVVERLLQEPTVQQEASKPKPMVGGGELMYLPLFHVISGTPRWQRLLTLGVDFESDTKKTMKALIGNGAPTDAVLQLGSKVKMAAVFATAYHQCAADIMVSGLELGFANQIDATFGGISTGGSALFLAITHGDRDMFRALLDAGADINAVDADGLSALHRAAKETDVVYFVETLLEKGLPVDPITPEPFSAFYAATYHGNLTVAQYLFDHGADRDRVSTGMKKSIMSDMLSTGTRNALYRVKFLLNLPDRNGSDGFMVKVGDETFSLFHFTIKYVGEFAEDNEVSGIMIIALLRKYNTQDQLDNTAGPYKMTALAVAAEAGNYFVVRRLLEYGASPNIPDRYGRTALDLVYKRYCFPEKLPVFEEADLDDEKMVNKILRAANENTTELMSLLKAYNAETRSWSAPSWIETDSGLRSLDWVLERLREVRKSSG
ncbi:Dual serine/threonine and tyrosine protein kinase [Fusarium oxysporum f. sp. rapae]|uniref:Dual serine/threonine and tyrosine protein kinase n=1 Tax=Fusarium oxysporum f. sp. rapae TaxID=485398 RepID=A0A8J5PEM8_FUSOX|nr:Dual serine/threonine and tyrosine protein kinase [Fusarium oxysporum f. sp. rapae]